MRRIYSTTLTTCCLLVLAGCSGSRNALVGGTGPSEGIQGGVSDEKSQEELAHVSSRHVTPVTATGTSRRPVYDEIYGSRSPVAGTPSKAQSQSGTSSINPARAEQRKSSEKDVRLVSQESIAGPQTTGSAPSIPPSPPVREPSVQPAEPGLIESVATADSVETSSQLSLDLSTALAMIGGTHPAVGLAQWRTQEAYARLERAEVLWLPSIQAGFSYNRHDGNLQNSNGAIVDANRSSLQYGLGAGAVGAGTTQRPGLVAQFHVADAIFQPEIADRIAQARCHGASAVLNRQLLEVALAYQELLGATQDQRVLEESRERLQSLSKLTADYAITGQGLQSDADRLQTEVRLVEGRLIDARERTAIASARLTQQLSLQTRQTIVPTEPLLVPIEFAALGDQDSQLVTTGLMNRPELAESQALVCAAVSEYERQRYAPFIPSVLLGFSTGGFGGGLAGSVEDFSSRYDFDALLTWEVRNLGIGERAARRESQARIEQARFEQVRLLDQVARDVSEAAAQVRHRSERIRVAEQAIESARHSYERNLSRIREGQGLPLEVLQSVRALEETQREYMNAVIAYNQAQFQLQWAQGWPVAAR